MGGVKDAAGSGRSGGSIGLSAGATCTPTGSAGLGGAASLFFLR